MDEDENLSFLLSMGFPDIEEAQRALRAANNDLNEAVAILTNEAPAPPRLESNIHFRAPHATHVRELPTISLRPQLL